MYSVLYAAGSELLVPVIAELGTSGGGFLAAALTTFSSFNIGRSDSVSSPLSASELSVSLSSELLSSWRLVASENRTGGNDRLLELSRLKAYGFLGSGGAKGSLISSTAGAANSSVSSWISAIGSSVQQLKYRTMCL
jgi:hypothetical protein